jgi:large subunit ribosomal protein L22
MDIKAEQKYLLASPRKMREMARLIKKLKPALAAESLPLVSKNVSGPLRKVILQALANAKDKGISEADLVFKEVQIGDGPRLKRGRPVSRGQWHPIKKRMSHIRVVLTSFKTETKNFKSKKDVEVENKKLQIKKGEKNVAKS